MSKFYIDAGTTYSKVIEVLSDGSQVRSVVLSKDVREQNIQFMKSCGHMINNSENEIIALAHGAQKYISKDATVLDLGSRDAKWVRFVDGKFKDMDWNNSCASSTGATVEMLLKFYDVQIDDLEFNPERFVVTCGIFGLEKIMDDISKGVDANCAISKFIHGIAYNAWNFAKKPQKLYLSGGFCENKCFVDSLKNYCEIISLGRFVLCEGLIDGQ